MDTRGLTGLTLRCGQGVRADLITPDVLAAMKRVGFRHLGIGVESFSDPVLSRIVKGATTEQIDRGVRLAVEAGFEVSLLFVVGTPGETLDDVRLSMDFARRYPVMKAFFFSLVPFPGTSLYEWVMANDALLAPYDELINAAGELKLRSRPFFETPEMPEADRVEAQRLTERCSKEIQVATLRRKLAHLGALGVVLAQAGRSDRLERWFITRRHLRAITDRVVFGGGPS